MKCKICDGKAHNVFSTKILNKHNIKYYYCNHCGFLQTEEPYWLKEAHNNSISITDTGIISRTIGSGKITSVVLYFFLRNLINFLITGGLWYSYKINERYRI